MQYPRLSLTAKIVVMYTIPAAIWILLSDLLLSTLVSDPHVLIWVQTWKGWWFVAVSAIGLYVILQRSLRTQQASRARLQAMFDNAAAGIVLANTNGHFTEVNERWVEMLGFTEDEAVQMSPQDITYLEDRAMSKQIYQQLVTGQIPSYRYEKRLVRKDGSVFWADVGVTAIRTRPNVIDSVLAIMIDIDERKQVEAALRESEDRLRCANAELEQRVVERTAELSQANQILQSEIAERKRTEASLRESQRFNQNIAYTVPDLLYVYDIIEQKNIYVNRQIGHMLGYSEAEIQAMGAAVIPTLLHPDDMERGTSEQLKRIASARDGDILELNYRMRHSNGTWRWLYVRETVFMRTADHIPQQILGVAQDITERKRTEETLQRYTEELRQNAEESRQFAYIVSHDLRAPLLNLKGFAGELQAAMHVIGPAYEQMLPHLTPAQQRDLHDLITSDVPEALQFIHASVNQMDHLINTLLKLSRLGRRELQFVPIDMHKLVTETLQTLAYRIESRQIQIIIDELPPLIADKTAMEQIMGNILNNAVLYLEADRCGIIEVMGEVSPDMTTFMIRDNGRGIAESDMDKVFAPFRRAGTPVAPGEGMGLAYVQVLVRRHSGHIWCTSTPGVGTTFFVSIPNQPAKESRDV